MARVQANPTGAVYARHLYCKTCREHHVVAFSCKARAVCPSCLGRRMSAGAANLVDHVLPDGETGAVTAIQRANSDLRLSPHFHTLGLDGCYSPDRDGQGLMFHPAPAPSQEDIEHLVERVSKRILRSSTREYPFERTRLSERAAARPQHKVTSRTIFPPISHAADNVLCSH